MTRTNFYRKLCIAADERDGQAFRRILRALIKNAVQEACPYLSIQKSEVNRIIKSLLPKKDWQ